MLKALLGIYTENRSSSLIRLVFEKTPSALAVLDLDLIFLLASSGFADKFGCISNDLSLKKIERALPVFFKTIETDLKSAIRGEVIKKEEYITLDNATSPVWLYWEIHQWRGPKGRLLGFVVYLEERTAHKTAEFEMERTIQDLRKKNHELERFAYVCSHDINEPLRSMSSFLQLIQKNKADQLDLETKNYMGFVMTGLNRLHNLVRDILAFSKVGIHGKHENASASAALQEAMESLTLKIKESQASVTFDPLPHVYVDKSQLIQLFINLLDNAIKFKGPTPPSIHVGVYDDGDLWCFSVQDNGIGIEKEYQEKIFEMFERLHGKHDFEGSGIGLAVCKKIVEFYGGNICLKSKVGVGSTFYFTLPKGLES